MRVFAVQLRSSVGKQVACWPTHSSHMRYQQSHDFRCAPAVLLLLALGSPGDTASSSSFRPSLACSDGMCRYRQSGYRQAHTRARTSSSWVATNLRAILSVLPFTSGG